MTLKHRVLIFINKIRFKKKARAENKRQKKVKEKVTFKNYLVARRKELEGLIVKNYGFTQKERKEKEILEERLEEVKEILKGYKGYGEKNRR
jgi:hypothetical protein